jgi:RNA polymerase sigma factor (TIGR02999 family)
LLIDAARARARFKRIAGDQRVSMPSSRMLSAPVPDDRLIALDDLLERLDARDPRLAAIVECRYFAGYSVEETAQALGINDRTVRRDWVKAKAWLARELTA